jgi:hypothetical protein
MVVLYWVGLGGGQLAWNVVVPWKRRLLHRYRCNDGGAAATENGSDVVGRTVGMVVCRETGGRVVVLYPVDHRTYKQRFYYDEAHPHEITNTD